MTETANKDSLVKCKQWLERIQDECKEEVPVLLVINKSDLYRDQRNSLVTAEDVIESELPYKFIDIQQTSGLDGVNVDEAIFKLVDHIIENSDLIE